MLGAVDWWYWSPQYFLLLTDLNGMSYQVYTLATCQANLDTGETVGQAVFTLQDEDWTLWRGVKPRAMWTVSLWLENRRGAWGPAWYGYIDEAHKLDDPTTGQQVVLTCTSPQKLFEVHRQTPSQAASLTMAYAQGVTGAAVLRYAAAKVGFPAAKLRIDAAADIGANTWGAIADTDMSDPTSQTWSTVLQNLLGDSGLEMFFTATGELVWRPLGYLTVPDNPRVIDLADVGHYDVGYGDRGVVTQVEVRYGKAPFHMPPSAAGAAYWTAPPSMIAALGLRYLTITAAYIGSNQNGAASYLAKALGQMSAANVGLSTIIQVADPLLEIGTVVEIPSNDAREGPALGYLASKSYNLTYKGPWLEVDGFTYVRAKGQSFPYGLVPTTPIAPTGPESGFATNPTLGVPDANLDLKNHQQAGVGRIAHAYNLVQDAAIPAGQVSADPSLGLALGAKIQLWTSFGAGRKPVGDRALYTVADLSQQDAALHLLDTGGVQLGYVVVVASGVVGSEETASPLSQVTPSSGPLGEHAVSTNPQAVPDAAGLSGTNLATPSGPFTFPVRGYTLASPGIVTQEFGPVPLGSPSYTIEGPYAGYAKFHIGIDLSPGTSPRILAAIAGVVTSVGYYKFFDTVAADGRYHGPLQVVDLGIPPSQPNSFAGYGYAMTIRAGDITTLYGHMADTSSSYVAGQFVSADTPIGTMGNTGASTSIHLHFGIFDHLADGWVDPRIYLKGG